MDIEHENMQDDDVNALKEKITELEREQDLLESEIAGLQRLLWSNFEELIDKAYLLRKAELELGKQRYKKIYDCYMKNEKTAVLKKHKRKAISGLYILNFSEVYKLLSKEIPDTEMKNSFMCP